MWVGSVCEMLTCRLGASFTLGSVFQGAVRTLCRISNTGFYAEHPNSDAFSHVDSLTCQQLMGCCPSALTDKNSGKQEAAVSQGTGKREWRVVWCGRECRLVSAQKG